ncbi:MAG: hypothetical protein J6333_03135, partial [Planctomycetes bacterium]|nr:hypothetical protein [Planctomycetota bacterium]
APKTPAPAQAAPAPEEDAVPAAQFALKVDKDEARLRSLDPGYDSRIVVRESLAGVWDLRDLSRNLTLKAPVPGDNYSALLDAKIIPDPYLRDNERLVQQYA